MPTFSKKQKKNKDALINFILYCIKKYSDCTQLVLETFQAIELNIYLNHFYKFNNIAIVFIKSSIYLILVTNQLGGKNI